MRGILGSQWRRYRLHLKTKHQEHILNVKSELKCTQISSTDTENVIGGELVRDKYSDETIETRRGSFRDKNYACEQTLMVSREGGLSFPHPRPRWLDILVVQCWLPLMFPRFFSCKAMLTLYRRAFCLDTKGYTVYCEHYPICDSPVYRSAQRRFAQSEKSRRNHRSYV